jgi:TRAP-type C4-dicarboxylate transport system permease small subunit
VAVLQRVIDRLFHSLEVILAIAFIAIVLLNFANIVGRYGFDRAIIWADEVQIFTMVALTFLGAAIVTWRRRHLRMDVISNAFPRPIRALLTLVESLLMLAMCAFAAWQASIYTWRMFSLGRLSDTAGVPMWIVHGTIAFGLILITIVALLHLPRAAQLDAAEKQSSRPNDAAGPT